MRTLKANVSMCFLSFFKASLIEKKHYDILSMLDQGKFLKIHSMQLFLKVFLVFENVST